MARLIKHEFICQGMREQLLSEQYLEESKAFVFNRMQGLPADAKYTLLGVQAIVNSHAPACIHEMHSYSHIGRTRSLAYRIASREYPYMDPWQFFDLLLLTEMHDLGRINDNHDTWHGERGAGIARELIPKYWPNSDIGTIVDSIFHHPKPKGDFMASLGPHTNRQVAYSFRDADALEMYRIVELGRVQSGLPKELEQLNPDSLITGAARDIAAAISGDSLYQNLISYSKAPLDEYIMNGRLSPHEKDQFSQHQIVL